MMRGNTVISLVLLSGCLLLSGACHSGLDTPTQGFIGFGADVALLSGGETKAVTSIKEGTEFSKNDAFKVYGTHYSSSEGTSAIFSDGIGNNTVNFDGSKWSYTPSQPWEWTGATSDIYDFVGVFPTTAPTPEMTVANPLNVSVPYDVRTSDVDLMLAARRRKGSDSGNLKAIVPLTFQHMTSAVKVVVENHSETNAVTVNSYRFKNLTVAAKASITFDSRDKPLPVWSDFVKWTEWVCASTPSSGNVVAPRKSFTAGWDFMIPQGLDEPTGAINSDDYKATLQINYTVQGESTPKTEDILLKNVLEGAEGSGAPVTAWEKGKKYIYYLKMRLDGGLLVRIVTTEWEDVQARTDGFLITDDE